MFVMYKTDNGLVVYESLTELIKKGITGAWEFEDNYYIAVPSDDPYRNVIWIVNKKTGQVSSMMLTMFFDLLDKAKPIDPETLKRAS